MGRWTLGHSRRVEAIVNTRAGRPGQPDGPAEPAESGAPPGPGSDLTPRRLYDSHFPFVWRNLRRLGVPDVLLEDAAQDVFLVVHRRWSSFDAGWSSVQTWLFGILMRVARNHRRSLRRRGAWLVASTDDASASTRAVASDAAGPADLVARREAAALLDRLLEGLDDEKRAVLVLVDVEQLSVPQAAEALGVNLNTAYWRLRAARKLIEKALTRIRAAENRGNREGGQGRENEQAREDRPRATGSERP
jgi:RNA polymerase sigma-70 factor (ECF subfamily)